MHTNENSSVQEYIKSHIRAVYDWPKEGIIFRDVTTLFEKPEAWRKVIDVMVHHYQNKVFDRLGALEARGFLIGGTLAYSLQKPLVLFRKTNKLPNKTMSIEYELEYGTEVIEMHEDAIHTGEKVLLIDDLIATGGTLLAADQLVRNVGAITIEAASIINLPHLKGSDKLNTAGIPTYSLCNFSD